MKILAIESSCDETAAAVIEKTDKGISILTNMVSSQIDLHKEYGGVFPEIASRAHTENIISVIQKSLESPKSELQMTNEMSNLEIKNSEFDSTFGFRHSDLMNDIDLIAVTTGPGLIGSLLVGVNTAKTLGFANNKPVMPVNHWLGHIYSCFTGEITNNKLQITNKISNNQNSKIRNLKLEIRNLPEFPLLALIVSGGHTGLVLMKSHTEIITLGETLDDAVGEAFDKVAKLLGLEYPGGPAISEAAEEYKNSVISNEVRNLDPDGISRSARDDKIDIKFPRAMLDRPDYNFSFSGLKTAVLNKVKELTIHYPLPSITSAVAAEFQQTCIDILIGKTLKAAEEYKPKSILLCGGVSANKELREQMAEAIAHNNELRSMNKGEKPGGHAHNSLFVIHNSISFHVPPLPLTGDNAAMIGLAAAYQIQASVKPVKYDEISANSNLRL